MGSPLFNPVQKSFMMLNLAICSLEPVHLLDCISLVGSQLLEQYSSVHLESEWSPLRSIEALNDAKKHPDALNTKARFAAVEQ